ncbi:unnamed protein product [Onchocerca flexuosa]|uniref:Mannose-P-dolichol utilization defect 1 protein homolog n=1 Tax=Onchocerca flexuosa TaxID=387005 RepID=A0A183I5G7_9BILA|nr:unnamed protein product [Onchocerca flexuosa]
MIIIVIQILWFSSRQAHAAVFLAFCWTISCAVMGEYISVDMLALVQAITIPVIIVAKQKTLLYSFTIIFCSVCFHFQFLQIWTNYQQHSTGQLSVISLSLQFTGCLVRIFTSLKETNDQLVIINYIIAASLNGIICVQFFLYRNSAKMKKKVS